MPGLHAVGLAVWFQYQNPSVVKTEREFGHHLILRDLTGVVGESDGGVMGDRGYHEQQRAVKQTMAIMAQIHEVYQFADIARVRMKCRDSNCGSNGLTTRERNEGPEVERLANGVVGCAGSRIAG